MMKATALRRLYFRQLFTQSPKFSSQLRNIYRLKIADYDSCRHIHVSSVKNLHVYQKTPGDRYEKEATEERMLKIALTTNPLTIMKYGITEGFKETVKWKDEWVNRLKQDEKVAPIQDQIDMLYTFERPEDIDKFNVICDSTFNEGFSSGSLKLTERGTGLFSGYLSQELPKDGKTQFAGYSGMISQPLFKSFYRQIPHDFNMYTHVVLKVRGDGRSYMFNLLCPGFYDVQWNDIYQYPLYTRGGPYWQIARIPFSKFFLSCRDRIQDKQAPLIKDRITKLSITAAACEGNFKLEIDYIGLTYDQYHKEEFAYEMYKQGKFIAGY